MLSKTQWSHVIFFQICHEKPSAVMHIFGQKTLILSKLLLYYGPNESIGSPFFPIFHEKITALISIFCQKNLFSLKKHIVLMSIFYEKNVHSLKNTVLSCHSFQIFHEKPNSVMPIFVQKNVNSVITTL